MKTIVLFLLLAAAGLHAEPRFAITTSSIAGGGSTLAGGRFSLTGTIAKAEAALPLAPTGGRFALSPGFWGYVVLNLPEMPPLLIRSGNPGFAVLAWPVSDLALELEHSPDLSPGSWTLVNTRVIPVNGENTVTISLSGQKGFFRLRSVP